MPVFCTRATLLLSLAALNAAAAAGAPGAAEIYRCTDANGGIVFSETSCGRDARKLELHGKGMPGAAPELTQDAVRPSRGLAAAPAAADDEERGDIATSAVTKDWAAFKCSTEKGMVFYRFAHCPKTIEVTRQHAEGEVQTVILDSWPVTERGTNVPTACQAIHGRSAARRWGRDYDDSSTVADAHTGKQDLCTKAAR